MHQQDGRAVPRPFVHIGKTQAGPVGVLDLGIVRGEGPVQQAVKPLVRGTQDVHQYPSSS